VHVECPIPALAELTVADDVDAGLDLLADDFVDGGLQTGLICRRVVRLAGLDPLEEFDQIGRSNQAADMGYWDAVGALGHGMSS
jgi:hypothetical protein